MTVCFCAVGFGLGVQSAHAVTIDWVTVGDPGNTADDTGYGAVADAFQIGKYEVTIGQYAEFLNAVAATDTYSLYTPNMSTWLNTAGISQSGVSGSYSYAAIGPSGVTPPGASSPVNRPISYVSWFDAARMANWLHNGQGSGSTETGAYTLNGVTSGTAPAVNPGAKFFVPTESQWYKAAFYRGGSTSAGYWDYATQSNTAPGNTIGNAANQANYNASRQTVTQSTSYSTSQNYLTEVGTFTASPSAYGTFDQSGNLREWTDSTGAADEFRAYRGGYWNNDALLISTLSRHATGASLENGSIGFRLAAPAAVPEPSTYCMALAGLACGGYLVRRRRKRA